jgi:hypothetical protein
MPVGPAKPHDPRVRLIREKYFSVRPKPLERWLWSKNVPASAERVFWLHWQEGQQRGDWCSEIPLRRVAQECDLDVSTVTRAYQCLARLGCIRRTDPGRDPANPFQQATAVTEVRIPAELLQGLHRYPNRRQPTESSQVAEAGRGGRQGNSLADEPGLLAAQAGVPNASQRSAAVMETADNDVGGIPLQQRPPMTGADRVATDAGDVDPADGAAGERSLTPASSGARQSVSPLNGLTGRERAKALAEITALLSPTERDAYHGALRLHQSSMAFDSDSKVSAEKRAFLEETLASLAEDASASRGTAARPSATTAQRSRTPPAHTAANAVQRKLSLFQIARLRRDIQSATFSASAPELVRQVVWSIESGALRRFSPLHALNIAVKKIREGSWTRPHRMPPNWARALSTPTLSVASSHEACSAA